MLLDFILRLLVLTSVSEGDYVDLALNPERFTGYAGTSTKRIWEAIYRENCFGDTELNLMNEPSRAAVTMPDTLTAPLHPDAAPLESDQCVEKRAYYKIISGLHASISTHICLENFNQRTGQWVSSRYVSGHPHNINSSCIYRVQISSALSTASHRTRSACSTFTSTLFSCCAPSRVSGHT